MPLNVAIFTTTSIFFVKHESPNSSRRYPWGEEKAQLPDGSIVYSHGRLEKALAEGYTVYVASTRRSLGAHDSWWVELVGVDNIFLAEELGDDNLSSSSGWRRLFSHLGLEWPVRNGREVFWTTAMDRLQEFGFVDGQDTRFKSDRELEAEEKMQSKLREIRNRRLGKTKTS